MPPQSTNQRAIPDCWTRRLYNLVDAPLPIHAGGDTLLSFPVTIRQTHAMPLSLENLEVPLVQRLLPEDHLTVTLHAGEGTLRKYSGLRELPAGQDVTLGTLFLRLDEIGGLCSSGSLRFSSVASRKDI